MYKEHEVAPELTSTFDKKWFRIGTSGWMNSLTTSPRSRSKSGTGTSTRLIRGRARGMTTEVDPVGAMMRTFPPAYNAADFT